MKKNIYIALLFLTVSSLFSLRAENTWRIKTYKDTDSVKLEKKNGVVKMSFSLLPRAERLQGHLQYYGAWADLLLEKPQALSSDDERILFETMMSKRRDVTEISLMPLISDEDGELFCFASHPAPQLTGGEKVSNLSSGHWQWRKTSSFYAGEAGAASKDVWSLESEGVDFTIGKKLTFLGFRLSIKEFKSARHKKKLPELKTGDIYLGKFFVAGEKIPYSHPFAFADTFFHKKGVYRFAAQIRDNFQSLPVREFVKEIEFDPEDFASAKQRIEFPLGPDGCYWIDWQVSDSSGKVVNSGKFREEAYLNPDTIPPQKVDGTKPPVLGIMRINPDHLGNGVYDAGQTMAIELRMFPKAGQELDIKWRTKPLLFEDVIEEGEDKVKCEDGKNFITKILKPQKVEGRPAYRLVVDVFDDGKMLDSQTYFFGYRNNAPLGRHNRPGKKINRHEYKKHPYNRTTFTPKGGISNYKTEEAFFKTYKSFLEESCELTTSFTFMLDLRDWEVLPGVYDTFLLDRVMDMAADYGMRLTIRISHGDLYGKNLYRWNIYERQYSSDGTCARGHGHYGAYSVLDPLTGKLWLDAYRALYARYQNHCAFEGYYLMQPGGEWTVVDQPWNGTFSGYDKSTLFAFRKWLEKRYGTIEKLNTAWEKSYNSFNDIKAPLPDFRLGTMPDFRVEWIDFCRFKSELGFEWMRLSLDSIRSYDTNRITIAYGKPREIAMKIGPKLDYCHNGGNHQPEFLWEYIDAWTQHKIGWISEPHHPHAWSAYGDPANRGWVLDRTAWVMTAQAGGGGANIHVYFYPWKTMNRLDFWGAIQSFDRFEAFKPVLNELHQMDVFRPQSAIAFAADNMTLWTKHRTTFNARLVDLRLSREIFNQDGVPYGNFLPERMDEYKLVMPNMLDEVISKENFENYVRVVKEKGAKMIITARTGSYVPELAGDEPFQLLKAFGIKPPSTPFTKKGVAVEAVCGDDAILFEKGRKIPFETSERLQAQLADPAIQESFWKFRFRWLPETDYFGYFPGVKTNGKLLAAFPDGGAALTLHKVGKGEVIVFWGLPDYNGDTLKGMGSAAAVWAGIENPLADEGVTEIVEGENKRLNRHYLLLWKEEYGTYNVKAPHIPDGEWFADDMITGQRIGLFDGKTVREKGIKLTWHNGYSALKYIRFSLRSQWFKDPSGSWVENFRNEKKSANP